MQAPDTVRVQGSYFSSPDHHLHVYTPPPPPQLRSSNWYTRMTQDMFSQCRISLYHKPPPPPPKSTCTCKYAERGCLGDSCCHRWRCETGTPAGCWGPALRRHGRKQQSKSMEMWAQTFPDPTLSSQCYEPTSAFLLSITQQPIATALLYYRQLPPPAPTVPKQVPGSHKRALGRVSGPGLFHLQREAESQVPLGMKATSSSLSLVSPLLVRTYL